MIKEHVAQLAAKLNMPPKVAESFAVVCEWAVFAALAAVASFVLNRLGVDLNVLVGTIAGALGLKGGAVALDARKTNQ